MGTLSKAFTVVAFRTPGLACAIAKAVLNRLLANPVTRRMLYAAGIIGTIRFVMGFLRKSPAGQRWLVLIQSKLQERFLVRLNPGTRQAIQQTLTFPSSHVRPGHPHATEAIMRNSATKAMELCASAIGREQWVLSPSAREAEIPGERLLYQLNDFSQTVRTAPIENQTVITMTDIDYYAHMDDWLHFGMPILAYTMVPETAGGHTPDGIFTLTDNWVECTISGGGKYRHKLWNYHSDSIWTSSTGLLNQNWRTDLWALFGGMLKFLRLIEAFSVTLSSVDHFRVGPHRRVVSIVPYAQLPFVLFQGTDYGQRLERLNLRVNGESGKHYHHVRSLVKNEEPRVSVAAAGEITSATIVESTFRSVRTRMEHSKNKLLSDVVQTCREKLDSDRCTVLYDYMLDTLPVDIPTMHYPGEPADHYTVVIKGGTAHLDDQKTYARRYANAPLVAEAVYPQETRDNEAACIERRINAPQREAYLRIQHSNPYGRASPPPRFQTYAADFLKQCIPEAGLGTPVEIDDVAELQNAPAQRARTQLVKMHWSAKFFVSSFQKREAYSGVNDPRNISTVPTMHTLRLSAFTYGCKKQVLKNLSWYMPAKTPIQIASTLHELAQDNDFLVEGDYSRFDGTITEWLRTFVERAFYLRWAKEEHHPEIMRLFQAEMHSRAVTRHGIVYCPGSSRLSGSPLTTDGNTIINAFVAFCAAREMQVPAKTAAKNCGVFYGDDSLVAGSLFGSADTAVKTMCRVSACLGLNLKAVAVSTTKPTMFLSRCFPDLKTSPVSFCDPMRAMLKIHTTTNTTRDILVCGVEKASAYLVTDSRTPLVSNWCNAYLRSAHRTRIDNFEDAARDVSWWAVDAVNHSEPWPQDGVEDHTHLIAEMLGLGPNELDNHCKILDEYSGDVMSIPALEVAAPVARVVAVVGGQLSDPTGICQVIETPYDYYNLKATKTSKSDHGKSSHPNRGSDDSSSVHSGNKGDPGTGQGDPGVSAPSVQAHNAGRGPSSGVPMELGSRSEQDRRQNREPRDSHHRESTGGRGTYKERTQRSAPPRTHTTTPRGSGFGSGSTRLRRERQSRVGSGAQSS